MSALRQMNQKVAIAAVFVAAMFMSFIDTTIVNVALPTIGRSFHVATTSVDTVSIAFLVSLAVFIPASGWLGDRFGGKRVLLAAMVVFTVASALCGLATSLGELVAFRVLQGVGGGMLMPVGMAMLYRVFPPAERVRASSILTVPTTLAPALGPVLGGVLVDDLSWRYVFYVNVPIGIATVAFGALALDSTAQESPGRFDLTGFLLAGVGLGLVMYGVSEGPMHSWRAPDVIATIVAGAVTLAALTVHELRRPDPLVDLRQLGNHLFRSSTAVVLLATAALVGALYVVTLFYQDGRSMTALEAGLSTFPEALGVMVGAQIASRLVYPRLGPRRHVAVGGIGVAMFIGLLSLVGAHTSLWAPRVLLFGMGLCLGQVFIAAQAAAFATISHAATGRASTLFNAVRQLGGALGVAAFTSVIVAVGAFRVVDHVARPNLASYHVAFLSAAGFALVAALAGLAIDDEAAAPTIVRIPRRRQKVHEPEPTLAVAEG